MAEWYKSFFGGGSIGKIRLETDISNDGLKVEAAFPTRKALVDAGRLFGEDRILTEPLEGLETARDVLNQEIVARSIYGKSGFCEDRMNKLSVYASIAEKKLELLRQNRASSNEIKLALVKLRTYRAIQNPTQTLIHIDEQIRYNSGEGFSDSDDDFGIPFDVLPDDL